MRHTNTHLGNTSEYRWLYYYLYNQVSGAYRSWSTSSRSLAVDAAGNEMMDAGVLHVASEWFGKHSVEGSSIVRDLNSGKFVKGLRVIFSS